jgi:hypothetical protein
MSTFLAVFLGNLSATTLGVCAYIWAMNCKRIRTKIMRWFLKISTDMAEEIME